MKIDEDTSIMKGKGENMTLTEYCMQNLEMKLARMMKAYHKLIAEYGEPEYHNIRESGEKELYKYK